MPCSKAAPLRAAAKVPVGLGHPRPAPRGNENERFWQWWLLAAKLLLTPGLRSARGESGAVLLA